jgi:enoyl-CoA hydratase/carnithine racemase
VLRDALEDGVLTLTLDRPEKRNALSLALMRELTGFFRELGAHRDIAAVILAANGPAFSAGHDLGEMAGRSVDDYREIFDVCCELMEAVQGIPQPVIAMVRGIATAAGCQLAATCDLVVAEEGARFGTPGVKIGLFCSTPMVAVSRVIGQKRALQLLLTGVPIDARTAAEWGLVNRVVAAADLDAAVDALAKELADKAPLALRTLKMVLNRGIEAPLDTALELERKSYAWLRSTHDYEEGVRSFVDKRAPKFEGR